METKLIKIDSLVTDNLQIRIGMNNERLEHYAAVYRETPDELPPVTVYYDACLDKHYLADGFHRVAATKLNKSDTILANVFEGTFDDALRFAVKANAKNGIHRTKDDMIHAMEIVWDNWNTLYRNEKRTTEDGHPSKRQLMSLCCVTDHLAFNFLQNKRVVDSTTPDAEAPKADAVTVTREHLEERNPAVREKLKDGKDRFGIDIPERLKPAFQSREPKLLVRELNRIYDDLEEHRLNGDIVFAPFVGHAMTHLANLINTVRHGTVYCVCRMCRGRGCGSCNNLGFQTKAQYDRNPMEFKAENV